MTPLRRALSAALLVWCLGAALPAAARPHSSYTTTARVTWYPMAVYGGTMADGQPVYPGAFACPRWAMGATVTIPAVGITGICEDTGAGWYFENGAFKLDVAAWARPEWMVDDWYDVEVEQ